MSRGDDISKSVFEDHGDYLLAHVEFDDQRQVWEKAFLRKFDSIFPEGEQIKSVLPFNVVEADSDVVNGHNGIWQDELH